MGKPKTIEVALVCRNWGISAKVTLKQFLTYTAVPPLGRPPTVGGLSTLKSTELTTLRELL